MDAQPANPPAIDAPNDRRGGWLLLAIDGPAVELAARREPFPVRLARDGAAFAAMLVDTRPAAAVVAMPPGSEADIDLIIRERRRRPNLRIVQLAPPDAVAARLSALERGFDEALPSSISADELAGRLAILVDRARATRSTTSLPVAGDMVLELLAHELRRDGAVVHLRPKEFGLLALLAAHPGRVYTRRQILDRVWGSDRDVDPRTVDVHVRWLRSKIEADPERPVHLVTVRGVGYRLDALPVR